MESVEDAYTNENEDRTTENKMKEACQRDMKSIGLRGGKEMDRATWGRKIISHTGEPLDMTGKARLRGNEDERVPEKKVMRTNLRRGSVTREGTRHTQVLGQAAVLSSLKPLTLALHLQPHGLAPETQPEQIKL